ncbi:MAG: DUF6588 family protein [Chloroflexota bacterium]
MRRFRTLLIAAATVALAGAYVAGKDLTISREFKLITSANASNYLKPIFTTIEESWNSNLYSRANYNATWSFGFDMAAGQAYAPKSQQEYYAELPDLYGYTDYTENASLCDGLITRNHKRYIAQPTLFGGRSTPVFAAPQNHFPPDSFYKSIAFVEGNNISTLPTIPSVGFFMGLPTRTQLRFRFLAAPIDGQNLTYYSVALNQNLDKAFGLWKSERWSAAANLAYHRLERGSSIKVNSYSAGLHFSRNWNSGFSAIMGFQFEGMNGRLLAMRDTGGLNKEIISSPYEEIRREDPFKLNIASSNPFQVVGGFTYKVGILELSARAAYAVQPYASASVGLWLFESEPDIEFIPEPRPLPVPQDPPTIAYKLPEIHTAARTLEVIKPNKVVLTGDVTAYEVAEDGALAPLERITLEEYLSKQLRALLPYVFFDEGASVIPGKYISLTRDQANAFNNSELLGKGQLENYYHVLNIIGRRLSEKPSARIVLTGCNAGAGREKNNKALSRSRAESIKKYFVDAWQISPGRIDVKAINLPARPSSVKEEDGRAENRRVEISSDDWEILAPAEIQDTLRRVKPGTVKFKTGVSGGVPSDWKIAAAGASGTDLKVFADKGAPPEFLDWKLSPSEAYAFAGDENINYSLGMTDQEGNIFNSPVKKIPVESISIMQKEQKRIADTAINVYNLILFEYDKAALGKANSRITDYIKSELPPNAIVSVYGFTDRIGSDEHNAKLSLGRAQQASAALGRQDARQIGKGESELIFDNSTPEGRFYCRTVVIEAKIPKNTGERK